MVLSSPAPNQPAPNQMESVDVDRLTPFQREFVRLYASGETAKNAYVLAGGRAKHTNFAGSYLLKRPAVRLAIKQALDERAHADPVWIIGQLAGIISDSLKPKENPTPEQIRADHVIATRALDVLARATGQARKPPVALQRELEELRAKKQEEKRHSVEQRILFADYVMKDEEAQQALLTVEHKTFELGQRHREAIAAQAEKQIEHQKSRK